MDRLDEEKRRCETRSEPYEEECLEGTSARTRPFSYDEIMRARKIKGSISKKMDSNAEATDTPFAGEMVFRSLENNSPVTQSSVLVDLKHITRSMKDETSWNILDSNTLRKNEDRVLDKHVGSRGPDVKLRSIVERNFGSNTEHDIKIGRLDTSIPDKGVLFNDDHVHEYHRKNSSSAMSNTRFSEKIEEKSRVYSREHHNGDKKLSRKRKIIEHRVFYPENYRNRSIRDVMSAEKLADQVRDITVKERRHKHDNGVGSIRRRISGKKYDTEKKHVELPHGSGEESRPSRRSLIREHADERNRNSVLHSQNISQHTTVDKTELQDLSLSSKGRSRREHSSAEKKRVTTTGSGSNQWQNFGASSGLGGYSPRKRKTDAGGKTPSPIHHSQEKRTARWDLPTAEQQGNSSDVTLSNMEKVTQSSSLNSLEFPGVTSVASVPLKAIHHAFSLHMQAIESVQLTEATRPMRRLYVDNLPASASEKDLIDCVNQFLLSSGINHIQGTQPCISCIIHKDKGQALLEFLTQEDASAALTLKALSFLGSNIILRRPKDYAAITTAFHEKSMINVDSVSDVVEDSPHKIFIGGISRHISSKMLLDVAKAFGNVKAFHFEVNDEINEACAFLEYVDHSVSSKACAGLSGLRLGGKVVIAVFATPEAVLGNVGKPPFYGIPEHAKPLLEKPTPILKLKNVLDPEHLLSLAESELEGLLTDIKLECSRFGVVKSVNIVKPMHASSTTEAIDAKHGKASVNGCSTEYDIWASRTQQVAASVSESGESNTSESKNFVQRVEEIHSVSHGSVPNSDASEPIDIDRHLDIGYSSNERCDMLIPDATVQVLSENGTIPAEHLSCHEKEMATQPNTLGPELETGIKHLHDEEMNADNKSNMENAVSAGYESASSKFTRNADDDSETDLSSIFETGTVFIEYRRSEAACVAAHGLHGRTFDGRVVSAGYIDEALYRRRFRR